MHKAASKDVEYSVGRNLLTKADLHEAASLINDSLGSTYTSPEQLKAQSEALASDVILARSQPGGSIIGVAVIHTYGSLQEYLDTTPPDQREEMHAGLEPIMGNTRVGVLKTVAVDPDVRGAGVGMNLTAAAVKSFRHDSVPHVISMGWTDHEGCHIEKTLERSGFIMLDELKNHWHRLSVDLGFDCHTCGNPCNCSAKVFHLPL